MRILSAFILSLLPFVLATDAQAATNKFSVLMDSDVDVATGCSVQGMSGVDQVFTTEVTIDDAGARVARTTLSVCSAGVPGPEVEISAGTWPVGYQAASGATLVETSMPFSLFPGGVVPARIRLGLVASQGAASHVALALPDGSSVVYPPSRGRRRAVVAPGEARVITLDGEGADWNGLDALFDGIAGTGSPALRMLKFFAFADQQTDTLFFRFDANLSSDAPFASDDVFARAAGEGLTVPAPGVLANDGDPNDLPLTALPVSPAAHGNVVLNPDGSFTYTPSDAASTQTDAFEYRASNGTKSSNPARVEITVSTTGPSAPVASNDAWTTSEDEPLVIGAPGVLANDADANGDALTSALATPPSHGSVVLHADGGFTYTPHLNYFGADTFTYTVSDGTASDTAQVTITIVSVNDQPNVGNMTFDVPENSAAGTVVGTVNVADADSGDSHTFAIANGNVDGAFAIASNGTITVANAAAIDFETHPQFVLTVVVEDDGTPAMSDTGTITISVLDLNDLPVAGGQTVATNEDTPLAITLSATDQDADPFVWTIVTPPAHGALSGTAPNLTYTPAANYFGADSFTFRVNDGTVDSAPATVSISVASVNDAPVAAADAFVVNEGATLSQPAPGVLGNDSDVDGTMTAVLVSGPANGTLTLNADGSFDYTHDGSETTSDSFSYRATDGSADSAVVTVSLTINPVNDLPVASGQALATNEDTPVAILLSATDADGDMLAWTIVTPPAHGVLSGTAPNLTYTPAANYFGADSFTFRVNDGTADSAPATVAITVASVNDTPVAVADAVVVDEAGSVNGDVLANDSDVEGPLTAVLDTNVAHGILTFNANGTFTYVHDGSETTSDSFTYHATDGVADSAIVTVSITINAVNDAPVNTVPPAQVTTEDVALNFSGATALSIADADAGSAAVEVTLAATNGTISLTGTNGLTFTAGANGTATMTFNGTIADINAALAALDFAPTPNFSGIATLTITTNDLGNTPAPAASDSDAITITVTAANDAPVAADDAYSVDEGAVLNEAAPGVLGNDSDVDSPITAVLVSDVTNGTLTLNADGSFTYTHDGSETTSDSFTYRATDGPADSAVVTVSITINPVNDIPVFTSGNAVSVPENSTAVLTVTTSDAENDTRSYSISGGADAARFAIDATTGALSFISAPDFEAPADADGNNIYLVDVTANDGSGTAAQSIAVTVTGVDEAPVASDATFTLDENNPNGTAVGTVTAVDPDAGETLTYAITAGNTGAAFTIDASTGAISVATTAALDFETTPAFALTVSVTDDSVGALSDTAAITINLNNVNEAPVVAAATVSLDENSANGTAVHTVTFSDPDTTGQTHTFAITAGNTSGAFVIDPNSGAISVANVAALDFESTPSFVLTVEVTDAGAPTPNLTGSATITINLNDLNENPVVADQSFSVDENSANGTAVGSVVASDPDAGQTLTYAITAGNALGAFAIDAATGEITVADTTDLDFETNPTFVLTVQVTDDGAGALTDTATITINLTNQNEAPSITPQAGAATLAENAANGTPVLTVTASDPDAGQTLTYAITAGNTGGAFTIDGSGVVTVAVTSAVDFETNPTFTLTIQVSDDGTPVATDTAAFIINVTDVNEAPVVNALTFSLPENSANGTSVGTATFSDQDAGQTHTFAITAGNDLGAFAIDANSGAITVTDMADLDFETNPTFSLTVEVTDNLGLPGSNSITIDLTDANEAPVVNDQSFNVDENSAIGTVVGMIAFTDSDGPGATFTITAGNAGGEFAVNSSTGQITVAKVLDYEIPPTSFVFTIQIDDGGTPAGSDTAQITIDVNDVNEAPVVNAASTAVDENTANGTSVTTVTFTDPDAGQTHAFAITAGNTGGAFAIHATTGEITVANVAALNFEATPSFSLTVEVTDNGVPVASGTATVTITLNDLNDAPVANDASFSVLETAAVGASVGTVTATDEDAGQTLTYSITAGNTGGAFAINAATGAITVATALDYETLSSYGLTVQVQDNGAGTLLDMATVTINVTNVNETPVANDLAASIDEDTTVGSSVVTVLASDPDGDVLTFAITSGNTGDAFTIHPTTGVISVAASLDFETTSSYTLNVTATDPGAQSDLAIVSITIVDVNEAPVVDAAGPFSIAENTADGTSVGTPVTFSDPDGGQTHTFAIIAGNTGNAFTIDNSGQITVATSSAVNFEVTPTFNLTVRVTDSGSPVRSGATTVTINLTDVNEAPVLNDAARSVDENAVPATHVGLPVTAVDEDLPAQTLTYSIIGGNTGNVFAINATTGQITVAGSLDFEGSDDPYTLVVQVEDNGTPALTDTANVTITLIDVNEAPVLNDAARSIDENSPNGTVVGAALPYSDPDGGQTHTFSITGGDPGGVFAVDSSGQITVADVTGLNFEATESFSLTVQITDNGSPALNDTATVSITVNNVNEAPTAGTDAYVYIANTELRIGGHAGNATAVASTSSATKLTANDADPDSLASGFANLAVVAASGTTANGSLYSIAADGSMVYTPGPGFTGAEAINYSLTDGTNTVSGTINFTRDGTDRVWYVQNNSTTSTPAGTSTNPFKVLAAAETASAANDIVYVLLGDGTTTGQNAGFTLKNNQKLWGNGVALIVDRTTDPDLQLIAAGSQPQIGNAAASGAGVSATNLTGVVQIRGLNIAGTGDAVSITSNGAETVISNNTIRAAGNEGIDFSAAAGTPVLSIANNTVTATGTGISVTGAASKTLRAFADNAIHGNTGGSGIVISTATFDSDGATPGQQAVPGGVISVGATGNGVGAAGVSLTSVQGTLTLSNLIIFNDNGAGLSASGTGVGFALSVNSGGSATGSIESLNGPAVDLNATAADLRLVALKSTNSTTTGVSLTNVTGTVTAESGSSITNATGIDFAISGGTATVTYKGTITDDVGQLVSITGATAGVKTFSGAITDGDDGDGSGISLTTNTGATVRFNGGLVLSTGSNAAFAVSGGGTVEVCDEAGCNPTLTGALVNKITTTNGTALRVDSTSIGAGYLEFRSISSNGAANGIFLKGTGSAGGLKIVGDNTNTTRGGNGSGGTIVNSTGADGATAGNGIYLENTQKVSLRRMQLSGSANSAIRGFNVTDFTLQYSTINGTSGNNPGAVEGAVAFGDDLAAPNGLAGGINLIDNCDISGAVEHNLEFYNRAAGADYTLTVSNSNIHDNSVASGSDGMLIEIGGSYVNTATVVVTGNTFDDNKSQALQANALGGSTMRISVTNNTLLRSTQGNEGMLVSNGGNADLFALIDGNNTSGYGGTHIYAGQVAGNATSSSALHATIQNNTVTMPTSATNHGIIVFLSSTVGQVADAWVKVHNNTVTNNSLSGTTRAIIVDTPDAGTSPRFHATVSNNKTTVNDGSGGVTPIVVQARQGSTTNLFNVFSNSATVPAALGSAGLRVRQNGSPTVNVQSNGCGSDALSVLTCRNPGLTPEVLGTVGVVGGGTVEPTLP